MLLENRVSEIVASIVILTYNRIELLDKLLESLCEVDRQDIEIIIVDNHSEDATEKILCEKYPQCIVIRTERNLGSVQEIWGSNEPKGDNNTWTMMFLELTKNLSIVWYAFLRQNRHLAQ